MNLPEDLYYTPTHEWIRLADGTATVGITEHAQHELSDVVYVELPTTGSSLQAGQTVCVVESVKAASDIYAPMNGIVETANEALQNDPGLINRDPYGAGWIFKVRLNAPIQLENFKSAAQYREMLLGHS